MEGAENRKIPNLSGKVTLLSLKSVFNGQYSSVYHGRLGDQLVAVKVLKEITGAEVHTMQRKLHRERTVWGGLRHPNVLPLYGFADDHELFQPFGALISPWRAQGNAYEFLKAKGQSMSLYQRINIWKGVVTGVEYLHTLTPALVHGDLKPANVLIDTNGIPQICDFGLVSILLDEGTSGMTTTSLHTGTDRYLAYELVLDGEQATPTLASDVFALGGIGLEFAFLQQPYANRKNNMWGRICLDIRAGIPPAKRPESFDRLNRSIWDLLDRCWERNTHERINARNLLAEVEALTPDISQLNGHKESKSEVATVATVPVTRPTVVSQATATHPVERRGSDLRRRSLTNSIRGATQQQQPQSLQQPQQQPRGLFGMFRPKYPKLFTSIERDKPPAPLLLPVPSKPLPPRAETTSPRRFAFSLPLNFRQKPKKSLSGASVEAVVGVAFSMAGESGISSPGSLRRSATPEYIGSTVNYSAPKQQRRNRHGEGDAGDEGDDYQDYADRDGDDAADVDDGLMEDRMQAVLNWNQTAEQNWQQSGERRARPGVSFDIPASESERDDSGLPAVSVAQGAGRVLRYRQFSDAETFVY